MDFRKKDRRGEGGDPAVVERRIGPRDRRRSQRILVDLEVDYRCEDTFLFAYITDLSALGIFIRTNNPEPAGTLLNLRFALPDDERPLELEGEVIWINPFRPGHFDNINPGMGVRFNDITAELKQRLVRLVRKIAYLDDDSNPDAHRDQDQSQTSEAEPPAEGARVAHSDQTDLDDIPVTVDVEAEADDQKNDDQKN
jgi:type IV pilus assembly protein PilZ